MDVLIMKDCMLDQQSTKHALIAALDDVTGRRVRPLRFVFWAV